MIAPTYFAPTPSYQQAVHWLGARDEGRNSASMLVADLFRVSDDQLDVDVKAWHKQERRAKCLAHSPSGRGRLSRGKSRKSV